MRLKQLQQLLLSILLPLLSLVFPKTIGRPLHWMPIKWRGEQEEQGEEESQKARFSVNIINTCVYLPRWNVHICTPFLYLFKFYESCKNQSHYSYSVLLSLFPSCCCFSFLCRSRNCSSRTERRGCSSWSSRSGEEVPQQCSPWKTHRTRGKNIDWKEQTGDQIPEEVEEEEHSDRVEKVIEKHLCTRISKHFYRSAAIPAIPPHRRLCWLNDPRCPKGTEAAATQELKTMDLNGPNNEQTFLKVLFPRVFLSNWLWSINHHARDRSLGQGIIIHLRLI